jgi:hypothetical protein
MMPFGMETAAEIARLCSANRFRTQVEKYASIGSTGGSATDMGGEKK